MRRVLRLLLSPLFFLLRPLGNLTERFSIRMLLRFDGEAFKRRRDAQRIASGVLSELSRLKFISRTVSIKRRRGKIVRVQYAYPLLSTADELWMPIDLVRFPDGIPTARLQEEDVLRSLEDRIHTSVRVDYLANQKLCLVARLGGTKFPQKLPINQFDMPADAPALAVPFGVDHGGEHVWRDLIELKHLLVTGATGGGKTTFQHAVLNTLISRNTAADLELWLLDLKRTEFNLYRPLMDKKNHGGIVRHVAVEPEQCIELLDMAYKEIIRRNTLMENAGATNINDYAHMTGQRMKRIVIMFDEFAILTTDKNKIGKHSVGAWATNLMGRIAMLGRSAGITIIIATQFVNAEVLNTSIRANFENRLAFSCADWRQSHLVVETSEADSIPTGRAVLRADGKTKEVQTCFIEARMVRLEVGRVAEFGPEGGLGDNQELSRFVKEAKLLVEAACEHLSGDFSRRRLLAVEGVSGVVSQQRFNEISDRLLRDGVIQSNSKNQPRRVAQVFFNNPGLLDALYHTQTSKPAEPNQPQTSTQTTSQRFTSAATEKPHHNEVKPASEPQTSVVRGLESSVTRPPAPDEDSGDDVELPDWFDRAFSDEAPDSDEDDKS